MDLILEKTIGSILESKEYSYSKDFLDQLTELSLEYLENLTSELSTYTRIQRRHQPSISDIKLLLKLKHIKNYELIKEIENSKTFPYTKELSNLLKPKSTKVQDDEDEDEDDQLVFFEQSSIMQLLPKLNTDNKPRYIPSYLPDLPPDYTYQSTPEYNKPLTDLKELRIRLVQESRMTEDSLYKLIENDEIEWRKKFEDELNEMKDESNNMEDVEKSEDERKDMEKEVKTAISDAIKEDISRAEPDKQVPTVPIKEESATATTSTSTSTTTTTPVAPITTPTVPVTTTKPETKEDFKFDIVEYAQKRKRLKLKKKQKLEDHYKARENDIFMKAELYYSPYAVHKPTDEINKYFENIISDGFKQVIQSVRKAELVKQEKIKQLRLEQELREKELQQKNEIKFSFPTLNQSESDLSDDENNEDIVSKEELNFDVPEKPQEYKSGLIVVHNGEDVRESNQQMKIDDDNENHQVLSILPAAAEVHTNDTKITENQDQQSLSKSGSPLDDINLENELNAHFGGDSNSNNIPLTTQELSDISSEEGGSDEDEEMEIIV